MDHSSQFTNGRVYLSLAINQLIDRQILQLYRHYRSIDHQRFGHAHDALMDAYNNMDTLD